MKVVYRQAYGANPYSINYESQVNENKKLYKEFTQRLEAIETDFEMEVFLEQHLEEEANMTSRSLTLTPKNHKNIKIITTIVTEK